MTPAEPNTVWKRPEFGKILANKDQSNYQSGTGEMMHMMRWSRPDMYDVTCNCARHMMLTIRTHYNAMVFIMNYCVTSPERGLVFKQHSEWDGISTDYKFEVTVKTDSDYVQCLDMRRSIMGSVVYMN